MTLDVSRGFRVLHVIARLNLGGAALNVLELAAGHRRRGHEVLVVAGEIPPGEESMEYLAHELDVPVRRIHGLRRELSPLRDIAALRQLAGLVRSFRADVVHTHAAKGGALGRTAPLLVRERPALVHTYHGHVLRGYFGRAGNVAFRQIERLLARRTGALIAVSREVRDDLVALGIAPLDRFRVVPYGFDLDRHLPRTGERERVRTDLGLANGTFLVGWVGRLTAIKRPLDLVRSLHALVEAGVDAALCCVGDGPDRGDLETLARSLGVAERCRLVGYQRQLSGWYAAFDALCLPSANEGTPVAAIEALAAGRPVVATRVGGVPAVVADGETGFLVEPGDVPAVASRLGELARDPTLRMEMGRRAAQHVRGAYALDRMLDDVEHVYRSLRAA
jgi:glycosyltransferase involved in cell wall biosynthesis